MKTITATYRIITPMFIGGAEGTEAELRIPSIKGAIRFWWRALNWCNYPNTKDLYIAETKIFGGTYKDKNNKDIVTTQSKVLFSLNCLNIDPKRGYGENYSSDSNIKYLAGQGIKRSTQFLPGNTKFDLYLKSKSEIDPTVVDAVILWGLLGGLGGRARKGFGSVAIQKITDSNKGKANSDFNFKTVEEYKEVLQKIIGLKNDCNNRNTPKYSAFSNCSKLFIASGVEQNALDAHKNIAGEYKTHRKGNESLGKNDGKRVSFGWSTAPREGLPKRQSSPIFLHIHPISKDFVSVRLYLPADSVLSDVYIYNFLQHDNTNKSIING